MRRLHSGAHCDAVQGRCCLTQFAWLVIFISRVVLNLSFRVVYPFLPAISRGLSIPLQQAGLFLTARSVTGLAGIFFGMWGERIGYVRWMLVALSILFLGNTLVSFSSSFLWALVGFALLGLAQTAYVPVSQAYVSASVPYSRRARVIGLIEASWSASWFLGIPVCGLLIAQVGWRSPFVLLALASLLMLFFTGRLKAPQSDRVAIFQPADPSHASLLARTAPSLVLFCTFLMAFANENIMIVFGAWLEQCFSLRVEALGFLSSLAGLAELAGELTVALAVDRLGKRRTICAGLLTGALAYLSLIAGQGSLLLAMPALMTVFFLFELTFVSMISYVSELAPMQRGRWLATNYSLNVAGRMFASLSGPWLWTHNHSILPNALTSCLCTLLSLALFLWSIAPPVKQTQ